MTKFTELGLDPVILKTITKLGFDQPTPIQREAIPLALEGNDIMGLAQTGTGKTAAFGLPLVQKLLADHASLRAKSARSLILAPTRELAKQIADNLRLYVQGTPLKISVVVGGTSLFLQSKNLARGVDILVATPGRLLDLVERKAVTLDRARFLVLDEADQMLDMGFIHSLRRIAKLLGKPRQTLLFSATMPKHMEELSQTYLSSPKRIEMAPPGRTADKVQQAIHFVAQGDKTELLKNCLIERRDDLSLVFARTKHGSEKLMKHLVACGFLADSIHGNKSQGQRDRAIRSFREGKIRVLVATDVAARGIDIPGVSHVYNYDLPEVPENYIHRVGRTARAGAKGQAIAFCAPGEAGSLRDIERLMGLEIEVASGEKPQVRRKGSGPARAAKPGGGRGKPFRERRRSDERPAKNHRKGARPDAEKVAVKDWSPVTRAEGAETPAVKPKAKGWKRPEGERKRKGGFVPAGGAEPRKAEEGRKPNSRHGKPRKAKKRYAAA